MHWKVVNNDQHTFLNQKANFQALQGLKNLVRALRGKKALVKTSKKMSTYIVKTAICCNKNKRKRFDES